VDSVLQSVFYRWTEHCRKVNIVGRYATTTSPDFLCSTQRLNNTLCLSRSAVTRIQFSCCLLRVIVVVDDDDDDDDDASTS
jgi:hypothetical protein